MTSMLKTFFLTVAAASCLGVGVVAAQPAPDTQRPSAPQDVRADAEGPDHVLLRFLAPADDVGVVGYDVLRYGTLIDTVGYETSAGAEIGFVIDAPDGVSWFQVQAFDAAGNRSVRSSPVRFAVDVSNPSAPTGLTLTELDVENGVATIEFATPRDDVGVTQYQLVVNGRNRLAQPADPGPTATVQYSSIPPGRTWAQIVAIDAAGNRSVRSAPLVIDRLSDLDLRAPSPPGNLQVNTSVVGVDLLTWTASNDDIGVTGYTVIETAPGGVQRRFAVDGGELSFILPTDFDGRRWFQVTASDASGRESGRSASVLVTR